MAEDLPLSLDDLRRDSPGTHRGCSVCEWIEVRPDAATWDEAFRDSTINSSAILRAMQKRGFPLKDKPVNRHRNEQHRG